MPEEETERKSKYNSGVAKEIRRNKLWDDANRHSREGKYSKWNEDLDRIWIELIADAKKKNKLTDKEKELKN